MLGRITQRSIAATALTNLQNNQARSAKLQEQITSGTSLSKGSDDSVRAAAALRLNDQIAVNTENSRNLQEARGWMTTQEPALQSTSDALKFIRGLVVQAGNGSLDANGLKAIAAQIDEAKGTILGDANTQYQGRAVFAGTSATTVAYATSAPYTSGDDGQSVERLISPGVTMTVNVSGKDVYGDGTANVFRELDDIVTSLKAGDATAATASLSKIDARINVTSNAMALIGAKTNQLDHAEDVNTNQLQYLQGQLDDVQGVDPMKAYLEYTQQSVAYQAALQVTAKTVQSSLLDFLR
ncbi:flagellar hook-associated protein FlgL [Kineococcus sp. SYSU DK001]|uniref:flagellar hook-associated protein FlgL n=1 Tax=Kineococcus sp. SYSU DK001 TaxID=3383122 RepID=UPI003D7CCA4F